MTIKGKCHPDGAIVTVTIGAQAQSATCASGEWVMTIDPGPLSDGKTKISVAIAAATNPKNVLATTDNTIEIDTLPPIFTSIDLAANLASGYLNTAAQIAGSDVVTNLNASGYNQVGYKVVAASTTCNDSLNYGTAVPSTNSKDFTGMGFYKVCLKLSDLANNIAFGESKSFQYVPTTLAASFTSLVDPFVKASDVQALTFSVGGAAGVASLSWSYSETGSIYGSESSLTNNATSLSATIPANTSSSTTAKIRLTAKDAAGNPTQTASSPFQVVTQTVVLQQTALFAKGAADGTSGQARFGPGSALASDGTYLYVGDQSCVRRVAISDGSTMTLAGLCSAGGSADGVGVNARFGTINSLVSLNQMLYVVDTSNATIRAIDINPSSGGFKTVTTVAGSAGLTGSTDATGSSARFSSPRGITTDGTFLYVADFSNNKIRKIDPSSWNVSTFAGSGTAGSADNGTGTSATFSGPIGIVYDIGTASLYVLEYSNCDIRKIIVGSTAVTTLSGTTHSQSGADGSAASGEYFASIYIDTDGTFLYTADSQLHCIRKTTIATGDVVTYSGVKGIPGFANGSAGTTKYQMPQGVAVVSGKLYVYDSYNFVIRQINLTNGISSTLAGPNYGAAGLDSQLSTYNASIGSINDPYDMVTTDGVTFYFVDFNAHLVRKFDLGTGLVTTLAGQAYVHGSTDGIGAAAKFNYPAGIAKAGNYLYVSEYSGMIIRQIDLSNNSVLTIAGNGSAGSADNATGTSATFYNPRGLVTDGTYLYLAEYTNNTIRRITIGAPWAVTTIAGSTTPGFSNANGTSARFSRPAHLALSGSKLYVSELGNHAIRMIDLASSNAVTTIAGTGVAGFANGAGASAQFNNPYKIQVNGTSLYVADYVNNKIRSVDLSTNTVSTLLGNGNNYTASSGALTSAYASMAILYYGGKLYFNSIGTFTMRAYDIASDYSTVIAGAAPNNPNAALAFRSVADGPLTADMGTRLLYPAADNNYFYFCDRDNYTLNRMNHDGSNLTIIVGSKGVPGYLNGVGTSARIGVCQGLAIDSKYLYFVDNSTSTIRRVALTDYTVDTLAGSPGVPGTSDGIGAAASFNGPSGLAIAGNNLYVPDYYSHTIRRISLATATLGTVTTVAGTAGTFGYAEGVGTAATFKYPIRLTAVGNALFVTDLGNNVIRKIDLATNAVSTLAGAGGACGYSDGIGTAAKFCGINGSITSDGSQYLYVADNVNSLVRKIRISDGNVTTFLGTLGSIRDEAAGSLTGMSLSAPYLLYVPGEGMLMGSMNATGVKLIK